MKTLIKGGTIVTAKEIIKADLIIDGDKIAQIGTHFIDKEADKVIDASGHYILPGGIDPHVHMLLPTPAGYSSDDFKTGSIAAIFGGTTTIIDFVTPERGQSLIDALKNRKEEAKKSLIDYSFHMSPVEWRSTTAEEIRACFKEGISSFKIYMAYKNNIGLNDEDIFKVMQVVGEMGGIVTLHCETDEEINQRRNKLANEGKLDPEAHALSRPSKMESKAVARAIAMAKDANCPIYIVHVSAKESIEIIIEAQKSGQQVIAETCPQYLLLNESNYQGAFDDTCKYVMSPPLRKKENNEALWEAIAKGHVLSIGTDHCPFTLQQKKLGRDDFRKIPNGAGGVEHRLPLLFTFGVHQQKISLQQFVDITATQPAKIFGLYPKKGEIAVGSDADIIIWNAKKEQTISKLTHHQYSDLNIYEGFKTKGNPLDVLLKGKPVVENNKMNSDLSKGQFLKRKKTNVNYSC